MILSLLKPDWYATKLRWRRAVGSSQGQRQLLVSLMCLVLAAILTFAGSLPILLPVRHDPLALTVRVTLILLAHAVTVFVQVLFQVANRLLRDPMAEFLSITPCRSDLRYVASIVQLTVHSCWALFLLVIPTLLALAAVGGVSLGTLIVAIPAMVTLHVIVNVAAQLLFLSLLYCYLTPRWIPLLLLVATALPVGVIGLSTLIPADLVFVTLTSYPVLLLTILSGVVLAMAVCVGVLSAPLLYQLAALARGAGYCRKGTRGHIPHLRLSRFTPPPLFRKEYRTFVRDPLVSGHMVLALILIIGVISDRTVAQAANSTTVEWSVLRQIFFNIINLTTFGVFTIALSARQVLPCLSLEGRCAWILLSAPISLVEIAQGKHLFWFFLLGGAMSVSVAAGTCAFDAPLSVVLMSSIEMLLMTGGITALAIRVGARSLNFDWNHPGEIASTVTGIRFSMEAAILLVTYLLNFSLYLLGSYQGTTSNSTFLPLQASHLHLLAVLGMIGSLALTVNHIKRLQEVSKVQLELT